MVTATGLGSGLDINALVTAIVDAERVPTMARIDGRKTDVDALVTGYGSLKTALSTLQAAAESLADTTKLNATTASTSSTAASVTATSAAQPASYALDVSQLASAQSLVSGSFASTSTVVGSGTLTIGIGTPTYNSAPNDKTYASFSQASTADITIAANSTLADVRDAINASSANINASILQSGGSYQLMITGDSTGANQGISVSVSGDSSGTDSDNTGLSQLVFNTATQQMSQVKAPTDAAFSLNGLALTSNTNTITDVVDGLTLTLESTTSSSTNIAVSRDTAAITATIEAFVSAYNNFAGAQKTLTKYDTTSGDSGALQGDAMTRTIVTQVRTALTNEIQGLTGTLSVLSQLGVSIQQDGSLKSDATVLDTAVRTKMDSVEKFFIGETVSGTLIAGFATTFDTLLDGFLDTDGLISDKLSALDDKLKVIETDRQTFTRRLESLEDRYLRQFNAMDSLLGQITTTGDMLQSQLDALPGYQNLRQSGRN